MSNNRTPKQTTIRVSADTAEKVRGKKEADGAASIDEVIRSLFSGAVNNNDDDDEEQEVPPNAESDGKKRKILVQEALITVDLIKKRVGMMLDYAGVTGPQFDMLFERLEEEVRNFDVLFMLLRGPLGAI